MLVLLLVLVMVMAEQRFAGEKLHEREREIAAELELEPELGQVKLHNRERCP